MEPNNQIRIDTGRSKTGTFIRVVHIPTGLERIENPIGSQKPKEVQDKLLQYLQFDIWQLEGSKKEIEYSKIKVLEAFEIKWRGLAVLGIEFPFELHFGIKIPIEINTPDGTTRNFEATFELLLRRKEKKKLPALLVYDANKKDIPLDSIIKILDANKINA